MSNFDPTKFNVPIIGQAQQPAQAVHPHPQLRLNAEEAISKSLDQAKLLGIRHARLSLPCALESTTIDYVLHLDAIEAAGCRIVSICEHAVTGPSGKPALICHVVFRVPESLFNTVQ